MCTYSKTEYSCSIFVFVYSFLHLTTNNCLNTRNNIQKLFVLALLNDDSVFSIESVFNFTQLIINIQVYAP